MQDPSFHGIEKLRLTPVQHFPAEKGHGEFWTRDLLLTGKDGSGRVALFSSTAEGLLTPEEKRQAPAPPACGHCGAVVDPDYAHQCDSATVSLDAEEPPY